MLGGGTQDEGHEETSSQTADLARVPADPEALEGVAGDEEQCGQPAGSLVGSEGLVAEDAAREGDPAGLCDTVVVARSEE